MRAAVLTFRPSMVVERPGVAFETALTVGETLQQCSVTSAPKFGGAPARVRSEI